MALTDRVKSFFGMEGSQTWALFSVKANKDPGSN